MIAPDSASVSPVMLPSPMITPTEFRHDPYAQPSAENWSVSCPDTPLDPLTPITPATLGPAALDWNDGASTSNRPPLAPLPTQVAADDMCKPEQDIPPPPPPPMPPSPLQGPQCDGLPAPPDCCEMLPCADAAPTMAEASHCGMGVVGQAPMFIQHAEPKTQVLNLRRVVYGGETGALRAELEQPTRRCVVIVENRAAAQCVVQQHYPIEQSVAMEQPPPPPPPPPKHHLVHMGSDEVQWDAQQEDERYAQQWSVCSPGLSHSVSSQAPSSGWRSADRADPYSASSGGSADHKYDSYGLQGRWVMIRQQGADSARRGQRYCSDSEGLTETPPSRQSAVEPASEEHIHRPRHLEPQPPPQLCTPTHNDRDRDERRANRSRECDSGDGRYDRERPRDGWQEDDWGAAWLTVQFKYGRIGDFALYGDLDVAVRNGDHVIVEGDRGVDLGVVVSVRPVDPPFSDGFAKLRTVKRLADASEVDEWRGPMVADEQRALEYIKQQVAHSQVPIRVHRAEFQFDRKKLTFHYSSASAHPDFRTLLRDGYRQFRCRIWMNNCNAESRAKGDHGAGEHYQPSAEAGGRPRSDGRRKARRRESCRRRSEDDWK